MRFFSVFRYFYKKIKVHFAFPVKYDILLNNYIRFARKVTVFVDFPGFSTYFWVQFAYWVENSSEVKIYTNRTRFLPLFRVNIHSGAWVNTQTPGRKRSGTRLRWESRRQSANKAKQAAGSSSRTQIFHQLFHGQSRYGSCISLFSCFRIFPIDVYYRQAVRASEPRPY